MIIAAATEAFSELIWPFIGMLTKKSHFSFISLDIPFPSLPIIKQIGSE